jgi:hypothetical protein
MALIFNDRVQQTGTANTTVSFTLSGSVTGFQGFTAGVGNGNTTYYAAYDSSGNWETGLGTYSTTGPTLTRTTISRSSNSNLAVTFSGTVTVFVTYIAAKSVILDASGNATGLGTPAAFVATNVTGLPLTTGVTGTLPIANGGTNSTATATAGGAVYGTGTAYAITAAGTSGNALISAGAGAPAFGNLAIGTANTNVSGALTVTNGGTGAATLTANGVLYGNGTSAVGVTAAGTTGQVLTANTGAAPTWGAAPGATITGTTTSATYYVVGTTSTSGTLSTASISNTNAVSYNASTGALTAVSMVSSSDERLKTNWVYLPSDFVSRLADVKSGTFERISNGNREVGVTAQSLKELLPEAVVEGENGMLSVNYGAAALSAAIELAKEVKALRAEIAKLKAK